MIDFLSREQSATNKTAFAALEADDYIAKIVEVDATAQKQKYDSFIKRGRVADITQLPADEIEPTVKVTLLVYATKSGDAMKDVDGKAVEPLVRRAYKDVSPYGGFNQKTGMPSDYRCLFGFALKQDPSKPFAASGIEDIMGKYIGIELIINSKGNNTVKAFKKVPDSFTPNSLTEEQAMEKYQEQKAKKAGASAPQVEVTTSDIPW